MKFVQYADCESDKNWLNLGRIGITVGVGAPAVCLYQRCMVPCTFCSLLSSCNHSMQPVKYFPAVFKGSLTRLGLEHGVLENVVWLIKSRDNIMVIICTSCDVNT